MFQDTIENNIKVAKADATREEVIEAAKKAAIHDFIDSLPQGYDTKLGELGDSVSGGERQRIGIARAFLHDAKTILLDEPTSGLDPVVRDEMLEIFQDFIMDEEHSILFSTHITSDLEKIADYVVMIHEGRVIFSEQKDTLLYQYGIWKGNDSSLAKLPKNAVLAVSRSGFGVSALVNRKKAGTEF